MRVARLSPDHAAEYRAIMLEAYDSASGAFASTASDRADLPLEWWESRVREGPNAIERVFGAFDGDRIVGVAGVRFGHRQRTRHRATLFGLFVLPKFEGGGVARALVERVLETARSTPGTRVVQLSATESNLAAIHLYESCGFRQWGTEPLAIRIDGRFVSKVHMWRQVGPAPDD